MPRSSDKRERLISAADELIHRQGYHRTTLADIAKHSGVPLGNVYYYFKTKEDLAKAVIEERRNELSDMMHNCDCQCQQPREALVRLVRHMADESEILAESGCPVGSLCAELDEDFEDLMHSADDCMQELMKWATKRFADMGLAQAEDYGFEYVSRIQGVILMGNAMHDPGKIKLQLEKICNWIESLAPDSETEDLVAAVH